MKNGARGSRVEEPLLLGLSYEIQWHESRVNLAELAKLRWIEGWSYRKLANHLNRTPCAINNYCQKARKLDFKLPGLTKKEQAEIKWAFQKSKILE